LENYFFNYQAISINTQYLILTENINQQLVVESWIWAFISDCSWECSSSCSWAFIPVCSWESYMSNWISSGMGMGTGGIPTTDNIPETTEKLGCPTDNIPDNLL